MKVAVTGATGVIGRELVSGCSRGATRSPSSRGTPSRAGGRWATGFRPFDWADPKQQPAPAEALGGRDAVVNLLGENVAQRWSEAAKKEIRDSRVLGTRNLVEGLRAAEPRPEVLISGSGSNYYGPRGDEPVDESGAARQRLPRGRDGRLGGAGAQRPRSSDVRVVTTRTWRRAERGGRRARQDAPLLQGRGWRTRCRREAVHALDPQRRRGRSAPLLPRRRARPGPGEPERARAGHEQGALEGARPGAAASRVRAGAGASR